MCFHTMIPPQCTHVPFFKFKKIVKRVEGGTKKVIPSQYVS